MDYYQEIAILPDPEFTPPVVMNTLYGKLHWALTSGNCRSVGVSFPDYDRSRPALGARIRLHGHRGDLDRLAQAGWLNGLRDHAHIGAVRAMPERVDHVVVRRVQAKSNPERLRRRLAKRKGISLEQARGLIPDKAQKMLDLPFVIMHSASTGHAFRLFIDQGEPRAEATDGEFSHYGLSSAATVPWF